ncbi:MAG: N-acetylmuramoyl-L-alanine amidase [Candidatus Electrothrix sp. YB6]
MSCACRFYNKFQRCGNIHFLLLIIPLLILSFSAGLTARAASSELAYKETVEWQYKRASDYYYKLKGTPALAAERENWLTGIHELQRIYRIDPESDIASSCLYTVARMYRKMYQQFGSSADLDKAVSFYTDVFSLFPQGKKADNALYALARIEQEERKNFKRAANYYYRLIRNYPDSSQRKLADRELQELLILLKKKTDSGEDIVSHRQDNPDPPPRPVEQPTQSVPKTKIVLSALKEIDSGREEGATDSKAKKQEQVPEQKAVKQALAAAAAADREQKEKTVGNLSADDTDNSVKKTDAEHSEQNSGTENTAEQQAGAPEKTVIHPPSPRKKVDPTKKYLFQPQGTVKVLPVQYWSSDNYTRVVIKASQPVDYRANLLDKTGRMPKYLSIDFKKSYIPPKYRSPVSIEDGLLKRIYTDQLDAETVRVYLETRSIADYKVFNLKDPFRVVVDVRGMKGMAVRVPPKKRPPDLRTDVRQPAESAEAGKELKETAAKNLALKEKETAEPEKETEKIITPKERKRAVAGRASRSRRTEENFTLAQQLGLGIRRIVIDPGHGGKDPGATAFGLQEKDIVLNVAKKIRKILETEYNYEVILTREGDTSLSLEERTAVANTKEADLFLSIHVNAHPEDAVRGVETFYLNLATQTEAMRVAAFENATSTHNMSEMQDILSELMQNEKISESSQLAEFVQGNVVRGLKEKRYRVKDLGVKQAPFYVLIGAEMPAVLAEISFITNPEEARLLKDEQYLQTLAEQIVAGVLSYAEHQRTATLQ